MCKPGASVYTWKHPFLEHRPPDVVTHFLAGPEGGSSDFYNSQALCWPGSYPNGCFENTTANGEARGCSDHAFDRR